VGSVLDSEKTRYLVVNRQGILTVPPQSEVAAVDSMSRGAAEAFARRMSRFREADPGAALIDTEALSVNSRDLRLSELLGIPDLEDYDPETLWAPRRFNPKLEVPLGTLYRDGVPTGTPYVRDLGSGNYGGDGVHSALQGQSGSGKSVFLENLVLSICAWHSPDKVNFMIIDFKGEASFLGFNIIPHIRGMVNDTGDPEILDRLAATLLGEVDRRKRLLAAEQARLGISLPDVGKYLQFREMPQYRNELKPLPILIVLIDEASIFYDKTKHEFTEVFTYIVKQGRSVGVWIHLASQELLFLRSQSQLWAEMNFKSSLVVNKDDISRAVIDDNSAHDDIVKRRVKNYAKGGHIFFKFAGSDPVHLRAANNMLEYRKSGVTQAAAGSTAPALSIFTLANEWDTDTDTASTRTAPETAADGTKDGQIRTERSEISLLIKKLSVPVNTELHNMWTPPLRKTVTLHQIRSFGGLAAAAELTDLMFPLGIIDHPMDHNQSLLNTDFSTNAGSVVIAGTAKSGRSTTLTTMIIASAIRHAPRMLSWVIIDQGGRLAVTRDLPNVAGYSSRGNAGMRARIFSEIQRVFTLRSRLFATHSLTGTAEYLRWRETNPQPADPYGYLFVAIDGWLSLQTELKQDMEWQGWVTGLGALIEGGPSFGIHFAVTTDNSAQDLPQVAQGKVSPIYLRGAAHGDDAGPTAKMILKNYPVSQPGLTLSPRTLNGERKNDVLKARIAVPVTQDIPEPTVAEIKSLQAVDYSDDIAELCAGISNAADPDQRIPVLRPLPSELAFAQMWPQWRRAQMGKPVLPGRRQRNIEIPLGINSVDMTIAGLPGSPASSPHTLVLGRPQSGRTTVLRTLIGGIVGSFAPHEAKIILLDERMALSRERRFLEREHYLAAYGDREDTQRVLTAVLAEANRRADMATDIDEISEEQQTFFDGPTLFVLVDNIDHYRDGQGSSPQAARLLAELIRIRARVDIHVIGTATHHGFSNESTRQVLLSPIAALEEVRSHILSLACGDDKIKIRDIRAENFLFPGRGYLISDLVPATASGRPPVIQIANLTGLARQRPDDTRQRRPICAANA
jgi:S-DNA-T family DNA segregation ATPase FtsK/SpoIIIE